MPLVRPPYYRSLPPSLSLIIYAPFFFQLTTIDSLFPTLGFELFKKIFKLLIYLNSNNCFPGSSRGIDTRDFTVCEFYIIYIHTHTLSCS